MVSIFYDATEEHMVMLMMRTTKCISLWSNQILGIGIISMWGVYGGECGIEAK